MRQRALLSFVVPLFILTPCYHTAGWAGHSKPTFQQAIELEEQGKFTEAFELYLTIPGAEYAAWRVARPKAKEFLDLVSDLLVDPASTQMRPRVMLIQGDLLLATGDAERALRLYRQVSEMTAAKRRKDWEDGFVPYDYYPVEPPQPEHVRAPAEPFTVGPGSHRDNWLIRRFIALEAWEEATREFARIWSIHRLLSQPHATIVPVHRDGETISQENRLIRPVGFNGRSLQFAIDYAYFLKRRNKPAKALETLMEPLLVMDMDQNPNMFKAKEIIQEDKTDLYPRITWPAALGYPSYWGVSNGISRKEFIRLAYGEFKAAGRESELVAWLQEQIAKGDNRARRVLARVRLHQGKVDEVVSIELDYIEAGGFDELTSAYRRGLVHEDCHKLEEAVAEYEKALALPYVPPKLPDKDEEAIQGQMMRQVALFTPAPDSPEGRARFQTELIGRLQRLYAALTETDRALGLTLRQLEVNPALLEDLDTLERTARRFQAAGKEGQFEEWVAHLRDIESPKACANLAWVVGDYATAAGLLAEIASKKGPDYCRLDQWKQHFREKGKDELCLLLTALVKSDPNDARSRLELLDLEDRFEGPDVIEALERLLEGDASNAFVRGKGVYNRTQFRNYFDLGYRLMRLYEKLGQLDKLRVLGLRMAKGEKPFGRMWETDDRSVRHRDENRWPEDVDGCLSLLVQHSDETARGELEDVWNSLPDFPAKRQLARRQVGRWQPMKRRTFGWANVPKDVSVLACNENVLSLVCDNRHIYAGMPWGVAVFTHTGEPVTRVALGDAALDLATQGKYLWVASPVGLNRITVASWETAYLALDQDIPRRDREPSKKAFHNGVCSLAHDGRFLWIGTRRNIQRLDTKAETLRIYSQEELGVRSHADWCRFIFDSNYVWASGNAGCRRYDRTSDKWTLVQYDGKEVELVALADGLLWGHVWLNKELRDRPCLIDRKTLEVTPILIEGNLTRQQRCINGPFVYFGVWNGKPVLGPKWPQFFYDSETGKLWLLPERQNGQQDTNQSELPLGLRSGTIWKKPSGTSTCYNDLTHDHRLSAELSLRTGNWRMVRLRDGTIVLAARTARCPRYQYPREDWPEAYETWDEEGGLYLIYPNGKTRRISMFSTPDVLPGDTVFSVLHSDDHHQWVCTNRGLAVLSADGGVRRHFTRRDGLCANRVVSAASLGGLFYFATGWGDHGGGLAVYDPKTSVFTSMVQSDGLATDKIAVVEEDAGKLKITYDVEYGRGANYDYRQFPPGVFNPKTGKVVSGGKARTMTQTEAYQIMRSRIGGYNKRRSMPFLGGSVISESRHNGHKYLCGTRGLVIIREEKATVDLHIDDLQVQVAMDPSIRLKEEARRARLLIESPTDLREYVDSANPFIRARALSSRMDAIRRGSREYTSILAKCVAAQTYRVQATSVYLLAISKDPAAIGPLKVALKDPDPYVRAVAAIGLARHGEVPSLAYFEDILKHEPSFGNFPFGVDSSVGVQVGKELIYSVLAPYANPEVFAFLLKYPLAVDDYEPRQKILETLGASLCRYTEAADMLLAAYDKEPHSWGQVRFAEAVFRYAGKGMLPILHTALASEERVVRSNAARACGAIGDPSSIPYLVEALDLESGLSRASIVWALGELKAKEALPRLAELYVDARNDENRRRGAGFRIAQAHAEIREQYNTIARLDSISSDWDEIKASLQSDPVEPRGNEELLSPGIVLDAVQKVGPGASQEFYRTLAGEKDAEGRREAAVHLADGNEADIEENVAILRNLLADTDGQVRMRAAISLLVLGQDIAKSTILEFLESPREWEKRQALQQLLRVESAARLRFARRQIEAIAADETAHKYTRRAARDVVQEILEK